MGDRERERERREERERWYGVFVGTSYLFHCGSIMANIHNCN